MAHLFREKCGCRVTLIFVYLSIACLLYVGCGGSSYDGQFENGDDGEVSESVSEVQSENAAKNLSEQIIDSPSFAGYLFLYTDEDAEIRLNENTGVIFSKKK